MLMVNNPQSPPPPNYNDKNGVSIWTRLGRETLKPSKLISIVGEFNPSCFQTLSDYDIYKGSSLKRVRKSISRNLEYFQIILEKFDNLEPILLFVTLEIGWFILDKAESFK